jgi:hypothetical protein
VFTAITLKLEQNITTYVIIHLLCSRNAKKNYATRELQTHLLATIPAVIANTHSPAPSDSYNRLAARVLRVLSPLLPSSRTYSQAQPPQENTTKGKKRARYEGDELFSSHASTTSSNPLLVPTDDKLHSAALFAIAALLPTLHRTTQSTIHRTLLALLLHLPRKGNAKQLTQEISRIYASNLGESPSGMLGVAVQALNSIERVSCGPTDF